jgi:hypothetical protein
MAIHEKITNYTIAQLKNDIVDYQQIVNLTTETGGQVSIAFPDNPPAEWLTFNGAATTVYLQSGEFDRVHHLLQTEAPLFFSALNLFGLRAFSLSTGTELPGEGPADDDALAQVADRIRQHAADSQAPDSDKQSTVP